VIALAPPVFLKGTGGEVEQKRLAKATRSIKHIRRKSQNPSTSFVIRLTAFFYKSNARPILFAASYISSFRFISNVEDSRKYMSNALNWAVLSDE
jgi:hypothetical protein